MNETQKSNNIKFLDKFKNVNSFAYVCRRPWETIEIDENGGILFCCPAYTNRYYIGNIYEEDFENIWNSEKAKIFRQDVLDTNYTYCNLGMCCSMQDDQNIPPANHAYTLDELKSVSIESDYPKEICLQLDKLCNAKCITCRDSFYKITKEKTDFYNKKLIPRVIKALKNAEILRLNGLGDAFCSPFCKKVIVESGKLYPNLKFDIWTNGINCTPENYKRYNLDGKVKNISFSMHSATEETHDKIFRTGHKEFKKVLKNLEYIAKKKENNEIESIVISFVVSSINYKEMVLFQELANKYNVRANFAVYQPWYNAQMAQHYEDVAVFLPSHPEHKQLVEILKNDIFNSSNCAMPGLLKNLIN